MKEKNSLKQSVLFKSNNDLISVDGLVCLLEDYNNKYLVDGKIQLKNSDDWVIISAKYDFDDEENSKLVGKMLKDIADDIKKEIEGLK